MSMELQAETIIGPYAVIGPIGSGGMGDVYRAHDPRLDRDVALKILGSEFASNTGAVSRFQKEAKAIAALSHPNIVTVFDCGFDKDVFYIAMELLEGETLRARIGSRAMPWQGALRIALSIADALRCAHEKGIIHRDLKPENIFITRSGLVKVLDFGLARSTGEPQTGTDTLTRPGTVIGTVGYMSPEQVRAGTLGPRTDIFSFGCVLYELLSGRRAFERSSVAETISAVLRDDVPDLGQSVPGLPQELTAIVGRCLEKNPRDRFANGADLFLALSEIDETAVRPPRAVGPGARKRIGTASLITLAGLLAATIYLGREARTTAPSRPVTSLAVLPFTNVTRNADDAYLVDGLTDAVINNLSPVKGFKVMSHNAVLYYRDKEPDPREVRADLGVDAMVTGRVSRNRDSLHVSVYLHDTRDAHQMWVEEYDRPVRDVSEIERELSARISESLQMRLSGTDEQRINRSVSVKPDAYILYRQGWFELARRTPDSLWKGIDLFQRSLQIDPTYAPTYAGIADSYLLLGGTYELVPPRDAMPKARAAAQKALSLDESLAEAHASMALIHHEYDWDWPAAEREFKRAIELDRNCAVAHQWYGQALLYRSRTADGLRELKRAEELDPISFVTQTDFAQAYWIAGDYDAAIGRARRIIDLDRNFWLAHWLLGLALLGKGDLANAATSLERAAELGGTPATLGSLAAVYAQRGQRDAANQLIAKLEEMRRTRPYVSPAAFVIAHGALGDLDRAYKEMERAFNERASLITVMNVAPVTEPIRRDPRYSDFAKRVGLPPLPK